MATPTVPQNRRASKSPGSVPVSTTDLAWHRADGERPSAASVDSFLLSRPCRPWRLRQREHDSRCAHRPLMAMRFRCSVAVGAFGRVHRQDPVLERGACLVLVDVIEGDASLEPAVIALAETPIL